MSDLAEKELPRRPWGVADYTADDVRALRRLAIYALGAEHPWPEGEEPPLPSPLDVKRALDWIIHRACRTYQTSFVPNDPNGRISAFIAGRQFVGQQINGLIEMKPSEVGKK